MDIIAKISEELGIKRHQTEAAVKLIDEGNTIPFIARYRKEATGALNDEVLRNLSERLTYLRGLEERKETVLASIEEQGKLTDELSAAIDEAATLEELERDPMAYVRPADMAIQDLKKASCSAKQCAFLLQGRPVPFAGPHLADGDVLRVYGPDQRLMGIARYDGEHHILRPHKMFAEGL